MLWSSIVFLFNIQLRGRWIYVHEFEFELDFSIYNFYNLTGEDVEKFPFLLDSIKINDDIHITENEYNELVSFLNSSYNIKWKNKYYEVQIRMS